MLDIENEIILKIKREVMEKIIYHQRLQKVFLLQKMKLLQNLIIKDIVLYQMLQDI